MLSKNEFLNLTSSSKKWTTQQTYDVFEYFEQNPSTENRNAIVQKNLPLINHTVKKLNVPMDLIEDSLQEGVIGLITAVEKFDYKQNNAFSTYAVIWIRNCAGRFVSNNINAIHYSEQSLERNAKIKTFIREYEREHDGKTPGLKQTKEATGLNEKQIRNCININAETFSMDATPTKDATESIQSLFINDKRSEKDMWKDLYEYDITRIVKAYSSEREYAILQYRYGLNGTADHSLQETADAFNISNARVGQIVKKCGKKIIASNNRTQIHEYLR